MIAVARDPRAVRVAHGARLHIGFLAAIMLGAVIAAALAPAALAKTFTVKTTEDLNAVSTCVEECSLRQAITDANESLEPLNTVDVPEGTYKLSHGPLAVEPEVGTTEKIVGEGV